MSLGMTLVLGLIAGGTILLGVPVGRLRRPTPTLSLVLNAVAIGVLLFLVWDVLSAAWEPVDVALSAAHEGTGGAGPVFGYGALFVMGTSVGLLSLVAYELWMRRVVARSRVASGARLDVAVTAATAGDGSAPALPAAPDRGLSGLAAWSPARQLSLLIAVGIGAHNFAEGLAIGQSAAVGDLALATALVIGFALHNATEGFGIVAPLAGDTDETGRRRQPSWVFLLTLAAIGGGPTFVGTWIGYDVVSTPVSVVFLSLAAGSIIYVILQLTMVTARAKRSDLVAYGLLIGLFAGFLTDGILVAAGA
jgi:ZIP family zinc transporter